MSINIPNGLVMLKTESEITNTTPGFVNKWRYFSRCFYGLFSHERHKVTHQDLSYTRYDWPNRAQPKPQENYVRRYNTANSSEDFAGSNYQRHCSQSYSQHTNKSFNQASSTRIPISSTQKHAGKLRVSLLCRMDFVEEAAAEGEELPHRIVFNVSGTTFETWDKTVQRFPDTMLGDSSKLWRHFCTEAGHYFFDRSRIAFESILYFYQSSGKLIRPPELTLEEFEVECQFFEIPKNYIEAMKRNEGYFAQPTAKSQIIEAHSITEKLWFFLDQPETSKASFIYGLTSFGVLVLWCAFCCAQTICRQERPTDEWFYVDVAFTSFFSIEYCLRFVSTIEFVQFLKKPLNIIDLMTSLPYLIISFYQDRTNLTIIRILRQFRLFRLIRLLKLCSSSQRIQLLKNIMASSLNDFGLLFLCLFIVVVIGGSLIFFVEMGTNGTKFTSVPESMWWAIQTVVVLGYGDIIPKSDTGKLIASFFMIFGALTISLPVLSVVTKLVNIYGRDDEPRW